MSFGNIRPFYTNYGAASATGPGILTASDQSWKGNKTNLGSFTITVPAQAGAAETALTIGSGDDATGSLVVSNRTTSDSTWSTLIKATARTTFVPLNIWALASTDSGTNPVIELDVRTAANAVVGTRPWLNLNSNGTTVFQVLPLNSGTQMCLKFAANGSTSGADPTTATRSTGTALVIKDTLAGGVGERAIGFSGGTLWYAVETSSVDHKFFAGGSLVATIKGTGQCVWTGGQIRKVRIALTSPVTLATSDDIVMTKLTTPGAVALTGFASPANGTVIEIIDATGDSGANNITFTPASGNVNGVGSKAVGANYGRWKLTYETTTPQWYFN